VPFNIPVSELSLTFQIRDQYTDKLLFEASTGSGIVDYDANSALIERFETDDFGAGDHNYEIKVEHADGWDKVVCRGKFPLLKQIIKQYVR